MGPKQERLIAIIQCRIVGKRIVAKALDHFQCGGKVLRFTFNCTDIACLVGAHQLKHKNDWTILSKYVMHAFQAQANVTGHSSGFCVDNQA